MNKSHVFIPTKVKVGNKIALTRMLYFFLQILCMTLFISDKQEAELYAFKTEQICNKDKKMIYVIGCMGFSSTSVTKLFQKQQNEPRKSIFESRKSM